MRIFNNQVPVKKQRLITISVISLFFLMLGYQSCKKADSILPSKNSEQVKEKSGDINVTAKFFQLPSNTVSAVKRVADELRKQNNNKEFIISFARKEGFAIWNKAMISISKGKSHQFSENVENNEDTTVIIPLVIEDSAYVQGFILAKVSDSVTLSLYRNRDYLALPYANASSANAGNVTTAENFALRMMLLDKEVFGYTKFELKDNFLFSESNNLGDSNNITRIVDFGNNGNIGNFNGGGTTGNYAYTVCVTITTQTTTVASNHCPYDVNQCPDYYTGILGPCDNCSQVCANLNTSYSSIYVCETWNDDGDEGVWPIFPSGGSGGGNPGGGNNPQCDPVPSIVASVVPVGCDPIPNPWPPVLTQEQLDMLWMLNHIKDSTNNPCVGSTLATLRSIGSKLPELIRSVFDTSSTTPFDMTIKLQALPLTEGGNTERNVSNYNYQVKLNSSFADETDLAVAVSLIHEAFHCQLMAWYRQTFLLNDTAKRRELVDKYGYLFTNEYISLDSNLIAIATGPGPMQHQDIAVRYRNMIGEALYQFALAKGIYVSLDYCKRLAWAGCQNSRAFLALSQSDQDDFNNLISAEKDPYGVSINVTQHQYMGHPCL